MASYQDLETRVQVIEDKLDFVMKTISVTTQTRSPIEGAPPKITTKHMLDWYRMMKASGSGSGSGSIAPPPPPSLIEVTDK